MRNPLKKKKHPNGSGFTVRWQVTRYKYFVTLLKYFVLKYLLSEYFLLILLTFQHEYLYQFYHKQA